MIQANSGRAALFCALAAFYLAVAPQAWGAGPPLRPPVPQFEVTFKRGSGLLPKVALSERGDLVAFFSDGHRSVNLEVWSVKEQKRLFVRDADTVQSYPGRCILQFAPDGRSVLASSVRFAELTRVPTATIRVFGVPSDKLLSRHELPPDVGMMGVLSRDGKDACSTRSRPSTEEPAP